MHKIGLKIEFLTKKPQKFEKPLVPFKKKMTNWSSHKVEFIKWRSNTSIQQANFINLDLIEQNPQFKYIQALEISISQNSPN